MKRISQINKFSLTATLLLCVCFFAPTLALATTSEVSVSPVVIDGKGKVREILRFNVQLENTAKHLVSVYPWVTDVDTSSGATGDTDMAGAQAKELKDSLARWIQVSRGAIDLLPGEQKEIPITVQINLGATPRVYHAVIHFSEGSDRATAEANVDTTHDVSMNIEVLEDINERLQLATFSPIKNIFSGKSASFQYRIENIGNRGEVPHGKVRIFDRDGREVATVDANQDGARLEPSGSAMLSSVWAAGGSFGRYKAMLDLEYGNRGTLQDTVFFWMIPWGKLISMFLTLILACVIIAVILHSRAQSGRRGMELAPAYVAPRRRSLRELLSSVWGSDEDDEEDNVPDEENEEVIARKIPSRNMINEMREVALPHPVRSRLPSFEPDYSEGTHLHAREEHTLVSPRHQVTLGKREKPSVPPTHVLNLRK